MPIRRLLVTDAQACWETRNHGLKELPEAFTTSIEEGLATVPSSLAKRFGGSGSDDFVLSAFADNGRLIGYAGFQRELRQQNRHKGTLAGMHVVPEFTGPGKKLLLTLIEEVREQHDMQQLNLSVTRSNAGARQLYLRAGFVAFGAEKNAIRVNGVYYDKEHMVLTL